MAFYYVDGDNMPGMNTVFVENLCETDEVIVCFAKCNTYYKSEKNRLALEKRTSAKVTFYEIDSDKNAVDFAIAVKAGITAARETNQKIYLISADHHFECIAKAIKREAEGRNNKVLCCETIRAAFITEASNIADLSMVHKLMTSEFGHDAGSNLYIRMRELYRDQFELDQRRKQQALEKQEACEEKKKEEEGKAKQEENRKKVQVENGNKKSTFIMRWFQKERGRR